MPLCEQIQFYSNFVVWDIKAMLQKIQDFSTDELKWLSMHRPISVSITYNIEGFTNPKCLINVNQKALIKDMMSYLIDISKNNAWEIKKNI